MTKDEILKMEAGRDLDELIAEKVMGLSPCVFRMTGQISASTLWNCKHDDCRNCYPKNKDAPMKSYSTDISAAWQVVEKMNCWMDLIHQTDGNYVVAFVTKEDQVYQVRKKTAPFAICRAALLAVMDK